MHIYLLLSAALIYLSFPPGPCPYFAFIAFAPYAAFLSSINNNKSSLSLISYGFGIWYLSSWWFIIGLQNIAEAGWLGAFLISLLPAAIGGLPYMIFGMIAIKLRLFGPLPRPILSAAILTCLVSYIPNFFPGNIAHSFYDSPEFIQIADLIGESGLLLIVNCINFLFACAWIKRKQIKSIFGFCSAAAIIIIGLRVYSVVRLKEVANYDSHHTKVKVGIIQPNIPVIINDQAKFVETADQANDLNSAIEATRNLAISDPNIQFFVWPEMPLSFSIVNQPNDFYALDKLAKEIGKPLFVSDFFYEPQFVNNQPVFRNSVHMLSASAENPATYNKNHLIPFGEYIPLEKYLPFLSDFLPNVRKYTAANEIKIFELPGGIRAGTPICLESIYSSFFQEFSLQGSNIIINPANDAYFGRSPGPYVHLALTTFRAIEFRIPIIRVTNSGISEIITSSGRLMLGNNELFKKKVWAETITLGKETNKTDPNRYGRALSLVILLIGLMSLRKQRRI